MAADQPSPPDGSGERPTYRTYRARPRFLQRGDASLDALRGDAPRRASEPRKRDGAGAPPTAPVPRHSRATATRHDAAGIWRVVRWTLAALSAWVALSVVLFLVSAQFFQDQVDSETKSELTSGGAPIVAPSTVLILGSDVRPKGSGEPGAQTSGRGRSDSIQLMRVGGGHSAKLSIPRDMVVEVPGFGQNKINAAYALGGSALAGQDGQAVPRDRRRPRDPRELRQVPGADRRDGRHRATPAAASSRASTAAFATAATRCGCAPGRRTSTASRRSRCRARARTSATRARTSSRASAASRRSSPA